MPTPDLLNIVFWIRATDPMDSITRLVRPEVRALKAYHVPDSKGYVKLDAMENPYDWPDSMVGEWLEILRGASPNRYPDPACEELKAALKAANDVASDCDLLLGNGSDEIIQILLMALNPGSTVMAPELPLSCTGRSQIVWA